MRLGALAALIDIGIPTSMALSVLARHDPRFVPVLDSFGREGLLSSALVANPEAFDATWVAAIRAGEAAGDVDLRLRDLAAYERMLGPMSHSETANNERRLLGSIWVLLRADVRLDTVASVALLSVGVDARRADEAGEAVASGADLIAELSTNGHLGAYTTDLLRLATSAEKLQELLQWLLQDSAEGTGANAPNAAERRR